MTGSGRAVLLRAVLAAAAGAWSLWVAWKYRLVDGGLPVPSQPLLAIAGGAAAWALLAGMLTGVACRATARLAWRFLAGAAAGAWLVIAWRRYGDTFLAQPDYARITVLLLAGAAAGAGFVLVLRRAAYQRAVLAVWLGLPFALLAFAAGRPLVLVGAIVGALAAAGAGRALAELLAGESGGAEDRGLRTTVHLALGLLALSATGYLLGVAHLAYPAVLLAAAVIIIVVTRRPLGRELAPLRAWLGATSPSATALSWVIGAAWALLLVAWVGVLAPETGPDALGGRQAIVKLWASDHALASYREMTLSYMAAAGETFYLMLYPLAGEQSAKLGQFLSVLALLPALAGTIRNRVVAVAILPLALGSSSLLLVQYAWGFVDLVQSLLYFAALGAGWLWWLQPRRGLLFVAGLLAAGAAAVKLTGLGAPFILGLVVLARHVRRPVDWIALAMNALVLAAAGLVVLGPWLLRSQLLSGNPVFPYANSIFESPLAPTQLIARRFGDPVSLAALVQLPWRVIFAPAGFGEIGTYHPLLLAVLPGVVLAAFAAHGRYWILTGLAACLLWWVTEQNVRYSIFAVLLLLAGGSRGLDHWLAARGADLRFLAAAMLGLLWLGGTYGQLARPTAWLFRVSDGTGFPLAVAVGADSRESYLSTRLRHVPLLWEVDRTAGAEAFVWELPWLRDHQHLQGRALAMPHCDQRLSERLLRLLNVSASPESTRQVHGELRGLGFTHLLLPPESPWAPGGPAKLASALYSEDFLGRAGLLRAANYGYLLLELLPQVADQPFDDYGANAFHNPEFDDATTGFPTGWVPTPSIPLRGGGVTRLNRDQTLYQRLQVEPGALYRFTLRFATGEAGQPPGEMYFAWRDASGRLLLYYTHTVKAEHEDGRTGFFQTAPTGATALDVTLRGPLAPGFIALQKAKLPDAP